MSMFAELGDREILRGVAAALAELQRWRLIQQQHRLIVLPTRAARTFCRLRSRALSARRWSRPAHRLATARGDPDPAKGAAPADETGAATSFDDDNDALGMTTTKGQRQLGKAGIASENICPAHPAVQQERVQCLVR